MRERARLSLIRQEQLRRGYLKSAEFMEQTVHPAAVRLCPDIRYIRKRKNSCWSMRHWQSVTAHIRSVSACRKPMVRVTDVQEIGGHGVIATVDGHRVAAGNDKLMKKEKIAYRNCSCTGTIVHLAVDGVYAGHILISDMLKPNAAAAMQALKNSGVHRLVMLTGDDDRVAQQVAGEVGITEVHSQLLPADKVSEVEKLLQTREEKSTVAFVGDGINDAPVLSRVDVGIAMGALGSDAAIEAADVVLMDDDPLKIAKAIRIARKCLRIVYENICFAIGIKLLCLFLVTIGIANMWMGIFADVGVMVIAVLNAIRALL